MEWGDVSYYNGEKGNKVDCFGHMRMYGCLTLQCTNASRSYTANPELLSSRFGYLCLCDSPLRCLWHFRFNISKLRLGHHHQNCSSHHLWQLKWQHQLCSGLGLELTLIHVNKVCLLHLQNISVIWPLRPSSLIPRQPKPPSSLPQVTTTASSLVSLLRILPPWIYFQTSSQSNPPRSSVRSCQCHA